MRLSFSDLLALPGLQRFARRLVDQLVQYRRSLLLLLPAGSEAANVEYVLVREMEQRGGEPLRVSVLDAARPDDPLGTLAYALDVAPPAGGALAIDHLLAQASHQPFVLVGDLDQVEPDVQRVWLSFLGRWKTACHSFASQGDEPFPLCYLLPALPMLSYLPGSDTFLDVRWWWGYLSTLELRLLCRLHAEDSAWNTTGQWREYMLSTLAGEDLALVDYLWEDVLESPTHIKARLVQFGRQQGWEPHLLRQMGLNEHWGGVRNGASSWVHEPPERCKRLWAVGALVWSAEYGPEPHSAALALLQQDDQLRHRLWRGQAELLLPLVDRVRLEVCRRLTQHFHATPDWPTHWVLPPTNEEREAVENSPLAVQLGHLETLLYTRPTPALRSQGYLLGVVRQARLLRNRIAHYQPVTFGDFEALWGEIERVLGSI